MYLFKIIFHIKSCFTLAIFEELFIAKRKVIKALDMSLPYSCLFMFPVLSKTQDEISNVIFFNLKNETDKKKSSILLQFVM